MSGRRVLLAVGGGIAAYKAVVLARELVRRGAEVRVVMTPAATRFVGEITFTGLLGSPPVVDLWDPSYRGEVHVQLAQWADAIVVAPATADLMARMAHGVADDAVTATLLCSEVPVLAAPAMHYRMWKHPATGRNVARLRSDGVHFVGPTVGALASGEQGEGRMSEPEEIADALAALLHSDLAGRRIVLSAGPTFEAIDPVRFVGNRSSGKMGFALARRAVERGARVTLITGPVAIAPPPRVEVVRVQSALEMADAISRVREHSDAIIMAAAVADFRPENAAEHKLKKQEGETSRSLKLVKNPDILASLGAWRADRGEARPVLVGFAVETENLVEAATRKLHQKGVDLIVANPAAVAFEKDDNDAILIDHKARIPTGRTTKAALADRILDWIRDRLDTPPSHGTDHSNADEFARLDAAGENGSD